MNEKHKQALGVFRELGEGKYKTKEEEWQDKQAIIDGSKRSGEPGIRTAYIRCDMATENNVALQRDRLVKRIKARSDAVQLGAAGAEEILFALAIFLSENNRWDLLEGGKHK